MSVGDRDNRYRGFVKNVLRTKGLRGLGDAEAIGGHFEAMGLMERVLLISQGLRPDGVVVDIGCGSARLAAPLSESLTKGDYLGTDVRRCPLICAPTT